MHDYITGQGALATGDSSASDQVAPSSTRSAVAPGPTNTASAVQWILVLPNGHEIRSEALDRVRARIPELDRHRIYSVEKICGRDYWRSLPKIDRIRAGKAIAYLVATGQLALESTTCPHAVPKKISPQVRHTIVVGGGDSSRVSVIGRTPEFHSHHHEAQNYES